MTRRYGLDRFVADMRAIAAETSDDGEIVSRLKPLAIRLARDKSWLEPEHRECGNVQAAAVHLLHEEPDHGLAVFSSAYAAGRGFPPHDHGTWAIVAGVEGAEVDTYWRRVDDGSRDGYAELEKGVETVIESGAAVAMVTGEIHSVENRTDRTSISLHVYGWHVGFIDRSQFDPKTNVQKPFQVTFED